MSTQQSTSDILSEFPTPHGKSWQATGDEKRHSDGNDMRMKHGIPEWDPERFQYDVLPDLLTHSWDPEGDRAVGGTDAYIKGKPGVGKSTLLCYLVARLIDINDETVFWRGSSSRSEWLPLAPWATLWLPQGAEIDATLAGRNPTDPTVDVGVDELEEIVRTVRRYRTPRDLLDKAGPARLHVVFPDPELRGAQAALEASADKAYETPPNRDQLFHETDPDHHWWIAFNLERVENGPHHWSTWVCDEIGDLLPQNARKDAYGTYQKVELTRDSWVDFRKKGHTVLAAGHSEKDLHSMIRRKLRWRIQMPRQANPTTASDIVGFDSVPMNSDMTSRMPIGRALCYTETNFAKFRWKDMQSPTSHKLKITIQT